jgi:hypothetical protein
MINGVGVKTKVDCTLQVERRMQKRLETTTKTFKPTFKN